jgi:hypothetical protein
MELFGPEKILCVKHADIIERHDGCSVENPIDINHLQRKDPLPGSVNKADGLTVLLLPKMRNVFGRNQSNYPSSPGGVAQSAGVVVQLNSEPH